MLERLSWCKHILSWLVIAHMPASPAVRYICSPYGAMAMACHISFSFPSHPTFFFGGGEWGGGGVSLLSAFILGRNSVHIVPKKVKSSHLRMYMSTVSGKIKVISRLREVMLNTKTSEVVNSDVILCC